MTCEDSQEFLMDDANIEELPLELLVHIFSYLSLEELFSSVQHVCLYWKHVYESPILWSNTIYRPDLNMGESQMVQFLKQIPRLRKINVTRPIDADIFVDSVVQSCPDIHVFHAPNIYDLSCDHLKTLVTRYPHLDSFSIKIGQSDVGRFIEILSGLKRLKSLKIRVIFSTSFRGKLRPIADGCPSLKHLTLIGSGYYVTSDDMSYFLEKKKDTLVYLNVQCLSLTPQVLKLLSSSKSLEDLKIGSMSIQKRSFAYFFGLTSRLKRLAIRYYRELEPALSEMFHIPWKSLSYLHLSYLTKMSLESIFCNCPSLETLYLDGADSLMTDGDFASIHKLSKLSRLRLYRFKLLRDRTAEFIAECGNMRYLKLSTCPAMSDESIGYLVRCEKMKELFIDHFNLTGSTLHRIESLLHLTLLQVTYCDDIDPDVLVRLKQRMPHLTIRTEAQTIWMAPYLFTS
uniref:F-box domain-containing protein n=1 Tax=Timema cristinae TaxID=61476 RepID=A0A7R9CPV2_TIMCR|nr:unnamed protein product [Timema cristinae]